MTINKGTFYQGNRVTYERGGRTKLEENRFFRPGIKTSSPSSAKPARKSVDAKIEFRVTPAKNETCYK